MNMFEGILHNENNATEMLKNLLNYKPFRMEFLNFLGFEKDKDIASKNFYTQVRLDENNEKYGIIDLYIEDNEKEYLVEIKINYNTSLTEKQTKDQYSAYLNLKDKEGKLFYLIPRNYLHKNKINGTIKYWEDFLKRIKKSELDKLNPFIEEFVEFFYSYWLIDKSYKFDNRELQVIFKGKTMLADTTIPKVMRKLEEIVEDVIGGEIQIVNKKSVTKQNPGQYGYLVKLDVEDVDLWFGVDYYVWEEKNYPLIIWIDSEHKKLKKILTILAKEGYEEYEVEDEDKDEMQWYVIYGFTPNDFDKNGEFRVEKYQNKILKTIDMLQKV